MTALLQDVSLVVAATVDWIQSFVNVCMSVPLILLFITFPLVGYGIGLLKRIIHL